MFRSARSALQSVAAMLSLGVAMAASAQPSNDTCANALPLPLGTTVQGTTVGATLDSGFPVPCTGPTISAPGVWYTVVGNGNTLTIETCTGTSYDSELHVFCTTSATPCVSLAAVICVTGNDDSCGLQSRVSFCSAPGQTYLLLVSGFGSNTGTFSAALIDGVSCTGSVGCAPPSTGACCANATSNCTVTTSALCGSGNTYQGADTVCTPSPCPPTGSCCAVGGCCSVGPQTICQGMWTLAGACAPNPCPAPANDACTAAIALAAGVPATGSNCAATDDRTVSCATTSAVNTHKTVWYTFTPSVTGTFTFNTCGSSFDTLLAIFSGDCATLSEVACNDQSNGVGNTACTNSSLNSRIPVVDLTAGTLYRVLVGAWGAAPTGGTYSVVVNAVVPGACCSPSTAACSISTVVACTAPNTYRGDGTACTPTLCGVSGACCAASGACTQVNLSGCPAGSNYSGDGTVCSPNPCPQPGACCPSNGCCAVANQIACTNGTWIAGAVCTPNPCTAPGNDTCAGATNVTIGVAATGSNCAATDDRPISCATQGSANTHKSIWFRFTPTHSAAYTLNACGSSFDTILAIYSGGCQSPVEVACNDDSSSVGNVTCPDSGVNSRIRTVNLVAGAQYLIELAGWGSFNPQGSYFLNIAAISSLGACCSAGVCTPTDELNCAGTFQAGTCAPNPCPQGAGACCSGSSCSVVAAASCTGANTRFAGAGLACNAAGNVAAPCCIADFNQSGGITVQDVFDYLTAYFSASSQADVNGGGLSIQDVFDFLTAFFSGCT